MTHELDTAAVAVVAAMQQQIDALRADLEASRGQERLTSALPKSRIESANRVEAETIARVAARLRSDANRRVVDPGIDAHAYSALHSAADALESGTWEQS